MYVLHLTGVLRRQPEIEPKSDATAPIVGGALGGGLLLGLTVAVFYCMNHKKKFRVFKPGENGAGDESKFSRSAISNRGIAESGL